MRMSACVLVTLLAASSACKKSEPAAQPAQPATPASQAQPLGAGSPKAAEGAPKAGGLTWRSEPPLLARPPKSAMRAAEYTLEGDPTAELTVFYFGEGQGGDVESNLTRWLGQFSQADGSDSAKHAKRGERNVGGIPVSLVEVTGTFSGGMAMPGAAAPQPIADAMLLGAIAKGPKGPVFFKLVGKRGSVESARSAFEALVESLKVEG